MNYQARSGAEAQNYYDLTDPESDINSLRIRKTSRYDCVLEHMGSGQVYRGFVLAKTKAQRRQTVCDISFQLSTRENKYEPRLTFRKAFVNFDDVPSTSSARHVRIPLHSTQDGRPQFWKMIAFLHRFKELIDLGEFNQTYHAITSDEFGKFVNNTDNIEAVKRIFGGQDLDVSELSEIRPTLNLKVLKGLRSKVQEFITQKASEEDVQRWLDEDRHKYRQQRCLILGLEYINFEREGLVSSQKIDVLTRVSSTGVDQALIELKSPQGDIFDTQLQQTQNNPSYTYKIHSQLARAIPQILEYKKNLESKPTGDVDLLRLGIRGQAMVRKCVIVIGQDRDDDTWRRHRSSLSDALSSGLEILTYTDLLNKLDTTISNLENMGLPVVTQEPPDDLDEFAF